MKKNLLSIIILALLIVNIVLTAIMMFSVVGASKQTSALVADIAGALKLELNPGVGADPEATTADVSIANAESYGFEDYMMIPLKKGEDGKTWYCRLLIAFSMNNAHKDFKTYGDLSTREDMLKDIVNTEVGKYTIEEAEGNEAMLKADILKAVQAKFESDFIYDVLFKEIIYQ